MCLVLELEVCKASSQIGRLKNGLLNHSYTKLERNAVMLLANFVCKNKHREFCFGGGGLGVPVVVFIDPHKAPGHEILPGGIV